MAMATKQADSPLYRKLSGVSQWPRLDFAVLMMLTAALVVFGLVAVSSSSTVTSYRDSADPFSTVTKQVIFVLIGAGAFYAALRVPLRVVREKSSWLLGSSALLLLALFAFGVGDAEVGSSSWLRIGSIGIQPSELVKLSLALWGAHTIAAGLQSGQVGAALSKFAGVAAILLGVIFIQKDLGMMVMVGLVVGALFLFAGVRLRTLITLLVVGLVGFVFVATRSAAYRNARIMTWFEAFKLQFSDNTTQSRAYQSRQGILSLADGGITGTGLGESRAKWLYLPEAKNDFIFAIIGEEGGFIGAMMLVGLFLLLGMLGIRTATRQMDPFLRLLAGTLTTGIVVQAFINISYVVGLLPVTGVQLPLISSGGTSIIITMASLGLLCSCARHEPEAVAAYQHVRPGRLERRLLTDPAEYVNKAYRRGDAGTGRGQSESRRRRMYGGIPVDSARTAATPRGTMATSTVGSRRDISHDIQRERNRRAEAVARAGGEDWLRGTEGYRRGVVPKPRQPRQSARAHQYRRPLPTDWGTEPPARREKR